MPERTPAALAEIEAIVAAVPRAYRADASWAIPLLVAAARAGGITHPRRIAYLLATAQHASHFGAVLVEQPSLSAATRGGGFYDRYEPGTPLGTALGNTTAGDGERFRGRGFVFIRGRQAYANWSQRLRYNDEVVAASSVPYFIAHPAKLAEPHIAAHALVRGMRDGIFTGVALGSYVNDKKTDYYHARRVIEGSRHAREVAQIAMAIAQAMQQSAERAAAGDQRPESNMLNDVRAAVTRLAKHGQVMPDPLQIVEWNGEARQGKFLQFDDKTCALHIGRGTYVRLDLQRDLNGIVPPEGRSLALKRSGEVRPVTHQGETNFWR